MDSQAIDAALTNLESERYGWEAVLPIESGAFLSHAVRLQVQTQPVPGKNGEPPPRLSETEAALVRTVLGALAEILAAAEREFIAYNAEYDPDAGAHVHDPHIWIDRDAIEDDGPTRWCFVVGRSDNEDYGYHLEFDGTKFLECWSGD